MRRALSTGRAAMTGKVTLVQDERSGNQAGFLLYVPVGKMTGARPGTAAFDASGWAYSPLRARELFGAVLARPALNGAATQVFDGPVAPENLLFRSYDFPDKSPLQVQRRVVFGGRRWTVMVSASPAFFASGPLQLTWVVVLGGALISLLLTALAAQQSRSMQQTAREVERATTELRLANEALTSAAHAREEAEAQVRQMQKIEAIGQLTGGIAHDFNNMLAIVMGNLDLAERWIDQPAKAARAISSAKQGALRAADLTQRLLAFGRKQALKPRPLDPNQLIEGMLELLRRTLGEQVKLRTALTSEIWLVEADPGQLENAVLNLAINSRDAMASGGTLIIETQNCNLDEGYGERHERVRGGQYVLIQVTDSGAGMPSTVLDCALDPFFTTKEVGKGTGLGLSQVFGFVNQSGGHLNILSKVGEGTIVKIYLPRFCGSLPLIAEDTDSSRDPSAPPRGQPDELILVVEDEEEVRLASVETLRDLGYTVVHAASGVDALNLLERHGGAALLFTDVAMPGMNGRELADEACSRYPDLRVLFTTGYTSDVIVHEGRLDPDVHLVPKPFTTIQLAKKVRASLDR
jgi:signal transduction histidine kinase